MDDPTGTPGFEKARALATALREAFQHGEHVGALEECRANMVGIVIIGVCSIVAQLAVMVVFHDGTNGTLVLAMIFFVAVVLVMQLLRRLNLQRRRDEQLRVVLQRWRNIT